MERKKPSCRVEVSQWCKFRAFIGLSLASRLAINLTWSSPIQASRKLSGPEHFPSCFSVQLQILPMTVGLAELVHQQQKGKTDHIFPDQVLVAYRRVRLVRLKIVEVLVEVFKLASDSNMHDASTVRCTVKSTFRCWRALAKSLPGLFHAYKSLLSILFFFSCKFSCVCGVNADLPKKNKTKLWWEKIEQNNKI